MNTTYFLDQVAGNVFNTKTTPALPTADYLGLSTTEPTADGTNVTEPQTDAGYARVQLTNLGEPVDGKVKNTDTVRFNKSTESWGTVTHYVVYDTQEAGSGNLLMYGELKTSRNVEPDTVIVIEKDALELTVRNPA